MAANKIHSSYCVKCEKNIDTKQGHIVVELDTVLISIIKEWISPQLLNDCDYVCVPCKNFAVELINIKQEQPDTDNEQTKKCDDLDSTHLQLETEPTCSDNEEIESNNPDAKKIKLERDMDTCNGLTEANEQNNINELSLDTVLNSDNVITQQTEKPLISSGDEIKIEYPDIKPNLIDPLKDTENNCHDNVTKQRIEKSLSPCADEMEIEYPDIKPSLVEDPLCAYDEETAYPSNENKTLESRGTVDEKTNGFQDNLIINKANKSCDPKEHGFKNGCVLCGCSVLNRKSQVISCENNSELQEVILGLIHNFAIRQVGECDRVCIQCLQITQKRAVSFLRTEASHVTTLPATTKPVNAVPVTTEPVKAVPVTTEPVKAVPITTEPVTTEPVNAVSVTTVPVAIEPKKPIEGSVQQNSTLQNALSTVVRLDNEDPHNLESDPDWMPSPSLKAYFSKTSKNVMTQFKTNSKQSHKQETSIQLINYKRAPMNTHRCIFSGCHCPSQSLKKVSNDLRVKLIQNQNYYVPRNGKICSVHLTSNNWNVLPNKKNSISQFTAEHIEDIFYLLKTSTAICEINFNDVLNIDDHLLQYWTGMTKEKFTLLISELPEVQNIHRGLTGLLALLIKHYRRDTDVTLASLMNIPRSTLQAAMRKVIELLKTQGDTLSKFLPLKN